MNLAQAVRYRYDERDYSLSPVAPEPVRGGAPLGVREHHAPTQAKVLAYHGRRSLREGGLEVLNLLQSVRGLVRFERLRSSLPHVEGSTLMKRLSIMCGRGDVVRYGEQSWRNQYGASDCGYWYGVPGGSTEYST